MAHKTNNHPMVTKFTQLVTPGHSSSILKIAALTVAGGLLFAGSGHAQTTLQLRFPFTDSSGTTTPSDTSTNGGPVTAALTMFNAAGTTAVNLHGAVGSGVSGNVNGNRAMDFTSDL